MSNKVLVHLCSSGVPQLSDAPSRPRDFKENAIHRTRPRSPIATWSSSDIHMPIVGTFSYTIFPAMIY